MPIVVRNPLRTDPVVAAAFSRFGVATVHEAQGRTGLLDPRLRPIHRRLPDRRHRASRSACRPATTG